MHIPKLLLSVLLAMTTLAAPTFAQDRAIEFPNLTGTWRLLLDKSDLEIEAPETVEYVIRHSMTEFEFERVMKFENVEDELKLQLTIGNLGVRTQHAGASLLSWVRIEDNAIALQIKVNTNGRIATRKMRFRGDVDGSVMIVNEEYLSGTSSYTNRWVFEKIAE